MLAVPLCLLAACAGSPRPAVETAGVDAALADGARELAGQNYPLLQRAFERLPADAPQRASTRAVLSSHLRARAAKVTAARDYELAREVLSAWSSLFSPQELSTVVEPDLRPLALFLKEEGERRGDEGHVDARFTAVGGPIGCPRPTSMARSSDE